MNAARKATRSTNRCNPIPGTLSTVPRYPDRLQIYRIEASRFWQVRATFGDNRIKRTTKETVRAKAIVFAGNFYEDLLRTRGNAALSTSRTFERCAKDLLAEHQQKAGSSERNKRFASDLNKQLNQRILPFFRKFALKQINYEVLNAFKDTMARDGLSPSTQLKFMVSVRLILKHATKIGLLNAMPIIPTVSLQKTVYPWFYPHEYKLLRRVAAAEAKKNIRVKTEMLTNEVRAFIIFMVNTFLRPQDWVNLKRKQVVQQKSPTSNQDILAIYTANSKTTPTPVVSMPNAVRVYRYLIARQDALGSWDQESYVFLPHLTSREHARNMMRLLFNHVVEAANLKYSESGEARVIYSLRHTAIALRVLKGDDDITLLFLARNCRTSVKMLDEHYLKPLTALMATEKIIGARKRNRGEAKYEAVLDRTLLYETPSKVNIKWAP